MTGFVEGLHDLGNGCYGYLQPDGSWASATPDLSRIRATPCSSIR